MYDFDRFLQLGAPGVPKRSLKGPKHMVWMWPTQLDKPVAVEPKSGPRGCPVPPKGPFWAETGPFGGPRSAVEVSIRAQAYDMDVYCFYEILILIFSRFLEL